MKSEIKECGEQLVDIEKFCTTIKVDHSNRIVKKIGKVLVRKTVAKKLCQAQKLLPKGVTFILHDAWRSQKVQQTIFQSFIDNSDKLFPGIPKERVLDEIKKYVHPWQGKYASGHLTGGAFDIRLVKNGRRLPMKSSRLSYQENSKSSQLNLPLNIRKNREMLASALRRVGFSNHPGEFWHWSYGDIYWAEREKQKIAIYGIVESQSID